MKRRAFLASLASVPFLAGAALSAPKARRIGMDPILGMGYHKDPDSWYVPAEHDASIPRYYRYTERMLCTCLYGMFSCVRSRLGYQCHTCGGWSWSRETIAMDIYHERRPACRGCGQRSGGAHLTSCPDQNVFDPMGHIVR